MITVILVILVLTIVGIGVAYFTQVEDRISGNDRLAKTSFYAAETGLRAGEDIFARYSVTGTDPINTVLLASPSGTFNPPGGGGVAKSFRITTGTQTFSSLNRAIPRTADTANQYYLTAEYSLYIRNNIEDPGLVVSGVLNPALDSDQKLNLISVGRVLLPGGAAVTRVLEEQLQLSTLSQAENLQKEGQAAGSSSATKGTFRGAGGP